MSAQVPDVLQVIDRVTERLAARFDQWFEVDEVREIVVDSMRRYRHLDHPAHFARSLAAQLASDRLESLRWSQGGTTGPRGASFLFVCSGNAGRSQIASAVMRAVAPHATRTMSAGDSPSPRILPAAIEALDELGISVIGEYPKPLTPELVAAADDIVALNCHDPLPLLDGVSFHTWSISLEGGSGRAAMRHTRDQIAERVLDLVSERGLPTRPL